MHFYSNVEIPKFTETTATDIWELPGYKEYALHLSLNGEFGASVRMEIYYDGLSGVYEMLEIEESGSLMLMKTYTLFAPQMGIVFYHPSAPMSANIHIYAACCPCS